MKTYRTILRSFLFVGVVAVCSSCNDWLEVKSPANRTIKEFFKTPNQAEQALLGIYSGLLPIPEYTLLMSDGRSDDIWTEPATDKPRDYVDISIFNPNIYTISTLNSAWTAYYKIIACANLFLEKMEGLEFDKEEVKPSFIGEARFLRAYAYFELVRYFGRVPISTQSLDPDEAMNIPQSEAVETYQQVIIPDLQYAVEHMVDAPYTATGGIAEAGRATRVAAKALLGRVYLTMTGYPLYDATKAEPAKKILKEVIDYADQTGKYWAKDGEEWKRIWISDNDNKYHIFEIQYVAEKDCGNPMVFYSAPQVSTDYVGIQMSGNKITCSTRLTELYNKNKADVRYAATVDKANGNFFTKFFEHKIKRKELGYSDIDAKIVDRTYFPINYPLIRLEDVMLMYAELEGPTTTGVSMVNRIRTRAGLSELSTAEKTTAVFQQCVADERRRELAFEGIRWHDLVRRNTYIESIKEKFMLEATDANGVIIRQYIAAYAANVKEGTYLYPIPDTQMKAKEGLYQQNEAYR